MGSRILITQGKKNMDHGNVGHTDFQTKARKSCNILFRGKVEREKESMGRDLSLLRRFKRPVICVGGTEGGCVWKRGFKRVDVRSSFCVINGGAQKDYC